jgi:NAD(P)-dependent dehydrogenase (short-subunit alcohol dehydrogenase family)
MPDGRLANPEEIAETVVFLLTEGARKINGSTICVDGAGSVKI